MKRLLKIILKYDKVCYTVFKSVREPILCNHVENTDGNMERRSSYLLALIFVKGSTLVNATVAW